MWPSLHTLNAFDACAVCVGIAVPAAMPFTEHVS